MVSHMLIYGNGCALIVRNGAGQAEALEPRLPGEVSPTVSDGRLIYNVSNVGIVPQEDVLHFRARSRDGLWGLSPVQVCKDSLNLYASQETAAKNIYNALGQPKMILSTPRSLSEDACERIRSSYASNNATATGKPLILREGMEAKTLDAKAADAEFAKARGWSLNDVARIFSIPPTMLQHLEDVRYNSDLSTLNKHYVDSCLTLWSAQMKAEIEWKMLRGESFEFDFTRIAGGTFATQVDTLSKAVGSGLLTPTEARDRLGLPPLEEEEQQDGDSLTFKPEESEGEPTQAQPAASADVEEPAVAEGLNGAQIASVLELLEGITLGTISSVAAQELIIAAGVDPEAAARIVESQKGQKPPEVKPQEEEAAA